MQEIKTIELVKQYKNLTAVDKLNLVIEQGKLFSLLGVNGAGKTTTIKMLTGLTRASSGEAFVGGYSITKEPEQVKRLIGVSPQETAVAPNLSVKENLELICGIYGFDRGKTEAKIRELTETFALENVLKRSEGGMNVIYQIERLPLMVVYLIIWAIIYSATKRNTKRINEMLEKRRENII